MVTLVRSPRCSNSSVSGVWVIPKDFFIQFMYSPGLTTTAGLDASKRTECGGIEYCSDHQGVTNVVSTTTSSYRADNRHARAALAAELLLLGDARHPHMGHRAGDAAGAPLTARSQDTSRPWPVHVHTLLMSTEPSHEPGALRHAPRGPSNWPRLLSLPRPGSRLPNRTSRLAG